MKLSKIAFFNNLNEFCWKGNGRNNLLQEEAVVYAPHNPTVERWINEWVEKFNDRNPDYKLTVTKRSEYNMESFVLMHKHPEDLLFPRVAEVEEEECEITEQEEEQGGIVVTESYVEEEEEN